MKTNYRGFEIDLSAGAEWSAGITNAATGHRWSQRATAPLSAGQEAALKRAQNLVDAFLALHGPQAA